MFRSKIKVGLVVVALSFLNACASGSAIVTGVKRPALDFNQVRLYLEAPEQYETIGIVKASSDAGITQQASQDYAVEELKNRRQRLAQMGLY
ncbi:hypothetical protein ACUT0J_004424 [Vibrio vulnificus]